jgi:hypothetical protein
MSLVQWFTRKLLCVDIKRKYQLNTKELGMVCVSKLARIMKARRIYREQFTHHRRNIDCKNKVIRKESKHEKESPLTGDFNTNIRCRKNQYQILSPFAHP